MSKIFSVRNILVLFIFFSSTALIVSHNFGSPTKYTISQGSSSQEIDKYEEYEIIVSNFNSYTCLSITSSKLPEKDSLIIGIPFLSLVLVSNVIVIIKRQCKLSKSEVQKDSSDYRIDVKISAQERIILDLVQDYLSKNRFLEINKVISYITNRLTNSETKLNRNGIECVINNLIKKNILVDGSKLTRFELLDNPNRELVYNLILENPGIHFMNIVNILGMSIFLVKWHISMLLKFKLIRNTNMENREIYFESKLSENYAKRLHFINRDITQKIIEYLRSKSTACSKYRISKELKLHPVTTTKYIQKLEELDVLLSNSLSNKTLYALNESSLF